MESPLEIEENIMNNWKEQQIHSDLSQNNKFKK
jgi:hypothetical protein